MAAHSASDLLAHHGHDLTIVPYGNAVAGVVNVALECQGCAEVLLDFDAAAGELLYWGEHDDCPLDAAHAHGGA